jgi:DNA mismatch repair protein MSH5
VNQKVLTKGVIDDIYGYVLDSRPSSEFHYEAAKNKLVNLQLDDNETPRIIFTTPGDDLMGDAQADQVCTGRQGRLMRLAGWIDLDSKLSVYQPYLPLSCGTVLILTIL